MSLVWTHLHNISRSYAIIKHRFIIKWREKFMNIRIINTLYWTGVWNVQTAITHSHSVNIICTVFVVLMFELFFVASVSVDGLFYGRVNDHISIKFALRSVLKLSKDFVYWFLLLIFLFHKLILVSFLFLRLICLVYHTIWIYDILIAEVVEEVAEDNRHLVFWHFFIG